MKKLFLLIVVSLYFVNLGIGQSTKNNIIKNAVKDYDGNTYDAVKIGKQVWTKTNMRCTHYADGTAIPKTYVLKSGTYIVSCEDPFYYECPISDTRYGLYYNWQAATRGKSSWRNPSGIQGVCPNGWHIPSPAEWKELFDYVGSIDEYICFQDPTLICKSLASNEGWPEVEYAGASHVKKLIGYEQKELNNATGFSILPAGRNLIDRSVNTDYRGKIASHYGIGKKAYFWTSGLVDKNSALPINIDSQFGAPNVDFEHVWAWNGKEIINHGMSVRCVRDIDTISQKLEKELQKKVKEYNHLFEIYPSRYQKYRVHYNIPNDIYGMQDSLNNMIHNINKKQEEITALYKLDSISYANYCDSLRDRINTYNMLLNSYPDVYQRFKITYSIPREFWGEPSSLHDTLVSIIKEIDTKQSQLIYQHSKDSTVFASSADTLQQAIAEINKKLLQYPYNLSQRTLSDQLSIENFGNSEKLHAELEQKLQSLPNLHQKIEYEIFNELKKSKPDQFVDIYFQEHKEAEKTADSLYIECRCEYKNTLKYKLDFIDKKLPQCSCRIQRYNEDGSLFKSKTEFDNYYNLSEIEFEQEITNRKQLLSDLKQFERELSESKSANLKKGINSDKTDVKSVVDRMEYHQKHCYYDEALAILFKYNEGLSKEWERNGSYFKDKAEMYEAYISEDYAKILKTKKKE